MGRYGQDLHNTACLALKQTNLLKKKSANRTTKTVRQLCNAKEHSCEAAQKAVEATKAAEKAVQNLAQFAGKLLSSSPIPCVILVCICCTWSTHTHTQTHTAAGVAAKLSGVEGIAEYQPGPLMHRNTLSRLLTAQRLLMTW